MRLTVGPLPAAVYWRRRALVLAGLALVVLVISYACGGPGAPTAGPESPGSSPSTTLLRPTSPTPTPTAAGGVKSTPTPTPFTLVSAGPNVPCSDAEMDVTASANPAKVAKASPVEVTITIKNISARTCSRDIGADLQELMVMDRANKIWSSDDCDPNRGSNVTSFAPGRQVSYTLTWSGRRSRDGIGQVDCEAGTSAEIGVYQLIARLDRKLSVPFDIHVEAPT